MDTNNTDLCCPAGVWRRYLVRYTLGFGVIAILSFSVYIIMQRTLIWNADAWSQHFKALVYYSDYLKSIIRTLISEGRLVIPNWDFSIGEGGDVLTTLHYYVIGDPIAALCVFVPSRYLYIFYDLSAVLRMYLAGIAFSYFCFLMGAKNPRAVTVGALTYVFSGWAITNAARHPFFLGPLIFFPLLLIGFEFVMRGRRPYLLMITVATAALSNFYFFYMLVIVSAFYVVCRLFYTVRRGERGSREAFGSFLRIAGCSVIGLFVAAVILLPVCAAFLQDSRTQVSYDVGLFYPLYYYCRLPGMIAGDVGGEYWLCAGFSVVAFPSVLLLFRRRERGLLKFFVIVSIVAACLPVVGYVLNGFSYVTNRWCWALAMLVSFITVFMWDSLTELSVSDYIVLCIGDCALFILCMIFSDSRTLGALSSLSLSFMMIILLVPSFSFFDRRRRERIVTGFACASIVISSLCLTSPLGEDYVSEHIEVEGINTRLYNNETAILKTLSDGSFYRYSGPDIIHNAGLITGMSSTQYYWSLSNPNVIEHNTEMDIRDYWLSGYSGWDGRTVMNTLSSVKYYVLSKNSRDPVPYGYKLLDPDVCGEYYDIYENENALPLAYTYDTVIPDALWNSLCAAEKESAMLSGVYISGGVSGFPETDPDDIGEVISTPYSVMCREGVTYEEGKFTVTGKDCTASIMMDHVPDTEVYLSFSGLAFDATTEYELYLGDDDVDPKGLYTREDWDALTFTEKWTIWQDHVFWDEPMGVTMYFRSGVISNAISFYRSGYQFYNGRDDFIANLGSKRSGSRSITITFPKAGVYTFDKMEVLCRPTGGYEESVAKLGAVTLDELTVGVDTVSGTISVDAPKILTFSIPYSDGWHAYVDGDAVELYRANTSYMAVAIETGAHTVELRYRTPYRTAGACISAAGVAMAAAVIAAVEVKRNRSRKDI